MTVDGREILITVKYLSECSRCGTAVSIGSRAYWTPGLRRLRHADEDGCSAAADAASQADGYFGDMEEF